PAVWIGRPRIWSVPSLPPEAVLDFDRLSALRLTDIRPVPVTGRAFILDPVATGDYLLLARLGENGPVLARTTVECFDLLSTDQTSYTRLDEVYADGSYITEMPISAADLPEGALIRVRIVVAAISFEDGTIEKWIGRDDLDENGVYVVRFVIGPGRFGEAPCHKIEVWLDGKMIGDRAAL
ncbi:MAG: hypothetical protein U1E27_11675, partial [Kiritimatiellia bacterium]|nr:hypothetical protein [Kiritimatiellia bacterium]